MITERVEGSDGCNESNAETSDLFKSQPDEGIHWSESTRSQTEPSPHTQRVESDASAYGQMKADPRSVK